MGKLDKQLSYIPVLNKKLFRGEKPGVKSDCAPALDSVDETIELVEDWMEKVALEPEEKDVFPKEFNKFDDVDEGTDFLDEQE